MQIYTHTLPSGAVLTGYLRDETTEMPAYNTRPAVLIIPGGGYERCSARETDPVAMQFLQAGYHAFTLLYTVSPTPLRSQQEQSCTCAAMPHACVWTRSKSPCAAFLPVGTWPELPPFCGMPNRYAVPWVSVGRKHAPMR